MARRDQEELIEIAQNLLALQKDKEFLEKEKVNLAAVKKTFASRAQFLEGEIKGAESYRAQLNARQKELIAKKLVSLNLPTSLGAGPLYCVDDRTIDPGFRPAGLFYLWHSPSGGDESIRRSRSGQGRAGLSPNFRKLLCRH